MLESLRETPHFLSQAVGTYAMTELRFAVFPDVVLQINPRLKICLYLLTIGTNGQNATNCFGDVNARAYVASETAIFVKPWHPVVKNPAILAIIPPQPILHLEFLALIKILCVGVHAPWQVFRVYSI